jgi:hypothetical protein
MIQTPALLFSILLALAYGTAYHVIRGRRLLHLPLYWLAAVLGFAAGQLVGQMLDLIPWTLGEIRLVEASLASCLFLVAVDWLKAKGPQP